MPSPLQTILLAAALPFAIVSAQRNPVPPHFELYAYGDSIGGLPLFYSDGLAFAGDPSFSNDDLAAAVEFTVGSPIVPKNASTTFEPGWSNASLSIPDPLSSSKRLRFLGPKDNEPLGNATKFSFNGATAMVDNGGLQTLFTGLKLESGIVELYWNDTSAGQVPVTLRRTAPANTTARVRR
ncbi:hypothetical protein CC80DRAFT_422510 [Byssothecium circinans]|uniref:Uncharacterized protein n=1 Tax=Byssothecium circinans TaxID=147558 RepID=A0A6A5TP30_9PLEO|nr:hypothetical protein CC80DRAFT_422510 [Byssothecium circinans]